MVGLGMVTLSDQPYALSQRKLLASEYMPPEIRSIDRLYHRSTRSQCRCHGSPRQNPRKRTLEIGSVSTSCLHFLRGIGPDDNINLIHYRICYRPDHISQRSSVIPHRCVKDTVCVWLHPSRESVFHDLERGLHLARIVNRHPSLLFDTKRLFVSRLRGLEFERMGMKRRLIMMGVSFNHRIRRPFVLTCSRNSSSGW